MVINRRHVSVMSTLFSNRRVRTLNVTMIVLLSFDVPKEFGVPGEIGDMTRSLEMAET